MTLNEYISKIKLENNIQAEDKDIEDYVVKKAKEYLKGKNGAVDNEMVAQWIKSYPVKEKGKEIPKKEPSDKSNVILESVKQESIMKTGMEPLF